MTINATLGSVVTIGPPLDPNDPLKHPIYVRDRTGALVDPATITVTVKRPDGTSTTPVTPTRETTGTFHLDYEPPVVAAMIGTHRYLVQTTNPDASFRGEIFFGPTPLM